jgi:hypothetical protein
MRTDDLHPEDVVLAAKLMDRPVEELEELVDCLEDIRALPEAKEDEDGE